MSPLFAQVKIFFSEDSRKRFRRCRRRWFGVISSKSLGRSLEGQIGQLFKIDVTSTNTVRNVSRPTGAPGLPRTAFIAFLTLLMSLSQTPDLWLAAGGWKRLSGSGQHSTVPYDSTSCEWNSLLMRSLFKSWTDQWSSSLALVKFVPLSDHISFGWPRTEMNWTKVWMNVSVSSELTYSMCTAQVLKHRNMQPYT